MAHTCRSARVGLVALTGLALAGCGFGGHDRDEATTATTAAAVATGSDDVDATWIDAQEPEAPPPTAAPPPASVPQGGRLRGLLGEDLNSWDVTETNEPPLVIDAITCNTLVGYPTTQDPERRRILRPELAEAMPRIDPDGLRYTFRIRSGIRYADGRELEPQDVKGTFLRMFDPRAALPTVGLAGSYFAAVEGLLAYAAGTADDISGITVTGRDVTFALTRRDGGFLFALAAGWACIVPSDAPRQRTNVPPPTTGPYMVVEHVPGQSVRLDRNPYWYDNVAAGLPADPDTNNVDGFDILIGTPPAEQVNAIRSGRADFVLSNDGIFCCLGDEATRLAADPATYALLKSDVGTRLDYATFDVHAEPFDDPRVRQAVNLAIDRRAIVGVLGGPRLAVPSSGLLPAPLLWPDAPGDPYPDTPRLDRARRLLRQAGIHTPVDGGKLYYPKGALFDAVVRRIVADVRRIGIDLRAAPVAEDAIFSVIEDPNRHDDALALAGVVVDFGDAAGFFSSYLTSAAADEGGNYGDFRDPAFDAAVARIDLLLPDPERRRRFAELSHDVAAEQAPLLSLYTRKRANLVSLRYGGYTFDVTRFILLGRAYVKP